jgi:hypothetical protein
MAKYYVQSGDYQLIVQANNARGAALWAVHRTLAQVLSFADERESPEPAPRFSGRLGESVTVHEQGFDRPDCQRFETFGLIHQWNQLMTALDRLQDQIEAISGSKNEPA